MNLPKMVALWNADYFELKAKKKVYLSLNYLK